MQSKETPYLVFTYREQHYAVQAELVREVLRLPELSPLEEEPPFIVGVINLRGHVVPVMDLDLRLGRKPARYHTGDAVVVVERGDSTLGIIVNEVEEVRPISDQSLEPPPHFDGKWTTGGTHLLTLVAKVEERILMVIDPVQLTSHTGELEEEHHRPQHRSRRGYFCPEATVEERALFHERAKRLLPKENEEDGKNRISLAVVALGGEYLGMDLSVVKGFANIRQFSPIPCCPTHILGNMNLRGDILTLVDLRGLLHIPEKEGQALVKAVVVSMQDAQVGIPVEEVVDVVTLPLSDMVRAPIAAGALNLDCLKGAVPLGQKMIAVLDLNRILESEELVVNEEV